MAGFIPKKHRRDLKRLKASREAERLAALKKEEEEKKNEGAELDEFSSRRDILPHVL